MGRVVLYSPEGGSLREVLSLQEQSQATGVVVDECALGQSWDQVLSQMNAGDELVVGSLSCFTSLNELLGLVAIQGVRVRSLSQPWFSEPVESPLDYLRHLYELSSSLHAAHTRRGLTKAALEGRVPGRKLGSTKEPQEVYAADTDRVDVLRREQRLTIVEACRCVGLSLHTYYRKRKQKTS